MKKMDEALREHYEKKMPRAAFFDRFNDDPNAPFNDDKVLMTDSSANTSDAPQHDVNPTHAVQATPQKKALWLLIAAALVAMMSTALWMDTGDEWAIHREIAMQHTKAKPPKHLLANYLELNEKLPHLHLKEPKSRHMAGLSLVGGKKCSIQHIPAIQMMLKDPHGTRYTLYQAPGNGVLDVEERVTRIGALVVRTWQEQGMLNVLAGPER